MPMKEDDIVAMIKAALPDAEIQMVDLAGDGDHYQAIVTSAAFAGKSRVEQHKMVYGALGDKMDGTLHALSVKTVCKN